MISRFPTKALSCVVGLAIGGLIIGWATFPQASAQFGPGGSPAGSGNVAVEYEYDSQSVESASIQTKLTEMGKAGWDVFSIVSTDGMVETLTDGKPHVITQRLQVTAKRAKKR